MILSIRFNLPFLFITIQPTISTSTNIFSLSLRIQNLNNTLKSPNDRKHQRNLCQNHEVLFCHETIDVK